jgi:hypothetical protein
MRSAGPFGDGIRKTPPDGIKGRGISIRIIRHPWGTPKQEHYHRIRGGTIAGFEI